MKLGRRTTIKAYAVVIKDNLDYAVVGQNPVHIIRIESSQEA